MNVVSDEGQGTSGDSQPLPQNAYLSTMMDTFDHQTLRDPTYRARFQAKLAEIKAVRAKHTFLEYATHQNLFQELQQIYEENLTAYQQFYLDGIAAFEQAKADTEAHKAEMHAIRYRNARRLYAKIEHLLQQEAYEENQKAKDLIEQLRHHTDISRKEMREWEEVLSNWDLQLKGKVNKIWAEDYAQLRQQFQQAQTDIHASDRLPQLPFQIDNVSIESCISAKQSAIEVLRSKASFSKKFSKQLADIAQSASSKSEFDHLATKVRKAKRARIIRWATTIAASALLIGSGVYYVPKWMQGQQEDKVWEEAQNLNTLQSYQDYLDRFPAGKYVAQAIDAHQNLPFGILDSLTDREGRLFSYEGELRRLLPHGKGKASFTSGATFEGFFKDGLPDSVGTYTGVDGSTYEGSWINGKRSDGTQHFPNGDVYKGNWKNGLYHGFGTLTLADGSTYSGGWINGIQEGKGSYTWADGSKYNGQWKAGKFHGKGVHIDSMKVKYDGYFVEGLREGEGDLIWPDSLIFEGAWKNNLRHGTGTLIWVKTNAKFEVEWDADTINGNGAFFATKPARLELTGNWSGTTENLRFYYGTQLHNTYKIIDHGMIVPLQD